jgi:hypothetical protein
VYVRRKGRIERVRDGLFEGEEAVSHLIERKVGPLGIRVDESSPWAELSTSGWQPGPDRLFYAPLFSSAATRVI